MRMYGSQLTNSLIINKQMIKYKKLLVVHLSVCKLIPEYFCTKHSRNFQDNKEYFKELEIIPYECPLNALFNVLPRTCSFKTSVEKKQQ